MSWAQLLRVLVGGDDSRELAPEECYQFFAAALDGGVPELELGALLAALRIKSETAEELVAASRAVDERLYRLPRPACEFAPVVLPTYSGGQGRPNLTPLLALLLRRLGIPVLMHGTLDGHGRASSAHILRELGILPCSNLGQAAQALEEERIAFVPVAAFSPGLASLLALRARLGVRNTAHVLAKLIDPFGGAGVRVVCSSRPDYLDRLRACLLAGGSPALLLQGSDGEPFADPSRRPRIEHLRDGSVEVLFEAEVGPQRLSASFPQSADVGLTASRIRQALQGEVPVPVPLVNQVACCLYACGYAEDMNQAKAIAAVETGSLIGEDRGPRGSPMQTSLGAGSGPFHGPSGQSR